MTVTQKLIYNPLNLKISSQIIIPLKHHSTTHTHDSAYVKAKSYKLLIGIFALKYFFHII